MFNLFSKDLSLVAPITGNTISLTEVPDPVFSQKMIGDGIAIDSSGDVIVAPVDGEISLILDSKHAFSMTTSEGIEILVHIGLDTVKLNGVGFNQLVEQNTIVKAGTPIIKIDRDFIISKGFSLITLVLIINIENIKKLQTIIGKTVVAGKDSVVLYKL